MLVVLRYECNGVQIDEDEMDCGINRNGDELMRVDDGSSFG